MEMSPYLSFQGDCEEAFRFYEQCFGGLMSPLFRYAGSPLAEQVPEGWADKVMHGSVMIGGLVLMGADTPPESYEAPKGFSMSVQIRDEVDADRVFGLLAEDGKVVMPLEPTFWAARFGMVVDRYGIPWQINCEGSLQPEAG